MSLVSICADDFIGRALAFGTSPEQIVEELITHGFSLYESWDEVIKKSKDPLVLSEEPSIIVYPNFVSDSECAEIVRAAKFGLYDSLTYSMDEGGMDGPNRSFRNSQSAQVDSRSLDSLTDRISALIEYSPAHMEELEVIKYESGGFFGDHYDWYDDSPGGQRQLGDRGNRVATALMYLNTPDGGSTYFPSLNISVPAVKGTMLVFKFPNCEEATLHRGCDVMSGDKWIATRFIRERGC
jgi:prolyl 4-hydroxylase